MEEIPDFNDLVRQAADNLTQQQQERYAQEIASHRARQVQEARQHVAEAERSTLETVVVRETALVMSAVISKGIPPDYRVIPEGAAPYKKLRRINEPKTIGQAMGQPRTEGSLRRMGARRERARQRAYNRTFARHGLTVWDTGGTISRWEGEDPGYLVEAHETKYALGLTNLGDVRGLLPFPQTSAYGYGYVFPLEKLARTNTLSIVRVALATLVAKHNLQLS
jgi:hypothetical protein